MTQDPLLRGLVAGFLTEACEICEAASVHLLAIEACDGERPPREAAVARALHTLKGSAGSIGLAELSGMAHQLEDVFATVRGKDEPIPHDVVDRLLDGLDHFLAELRVRAEGSGAEAERTNEPDPSWRISTREMGAFMVEVDRLRELRLRLDERQRNVQGMLSTLTGLSSVADLRAQLTLLDRTLRLDAGDAGDILDALEDRVKRISAQPVLTIVEPLRRLVRDRCRASGKEAELSVVGAEISIDRHVLQGLRESLVHLVNNAIDHGIEPPSDRDRAGKHRQGALVLRVEQHGNVLYVEFSDDGGGLDDDGLRAAAIRKSLLSEADVLALPVSELHRLIWSSGFSTTTRVTETSGRGVGLDVVKRWIDRLGGHGEVHSTPGQGTRFAFTLPIEFGSSPTLLVRVAGHDLGIPVAVVERMFAAAPGSNMTEDRGELVRAGRRVPIVDLGAMLGLRAALGPSRGQPLIVVQSEGVRRAIAVDEVLGDLDLVVRAIPKEASDGGAFQGASTMARGDLLLIVRPGWLVHAVAVDAPESRRALVVDDSLTARALHRAILEAAGYRVHAVGSGPEALEWLSRARYSVVVCDVAMAPMDGLAFAGAVRSSDRYGDTPIVLVSAREEAGLESRGLAAGADAFLSKSECAAGGLLAVVSSAVDRRRA